MYKIVRAYPKTSIFVSVFLITGAGIGCLLKKYWHVIKVISIQACYSLLKLKNTNISNLTNLMTSNSQ
jgi:hypothetical protein